MSSAEISAALPLPVVITNADSANAGRLLPEEFKEGSQWVVQHLISSVYVVVTIHQVAGSWINCDAEGTFPHKSVWLNPVTMDGYIWQKK